MKPCLYEEWNFNEIDDANLQVIQQISKKNTIKESIKDILKLPLN